MGVFLILLAFFLNTFKVLKEDKSIYFILNIVGAGLACYASYLIRYWPFVVLEGVWCIVSIAGWIRKKQTTAK